MNQTIFLNKLKSIFLVIIVIGISQSCKEVAQVLQQLNVQEPNASVKSVKISSLSLQKVDLLFDVDVENPNSMGIQLAGMDYNILLDGASFIKGQKDDRLEIAANGHSSVQVPLTLTFDEIRKAVKAFADQDTIPYQLDLKIGVELPVLGAIKVPVTKKGSVPNLKMPSIRLAGIKLNKIGFTGANLDFKINIDNPNVLGFITQNLNYNLDVNGKHWISGLLDQPIQIQEKSAQTVRVPVSLNFLEMGSAVYQLLSGNNKLDYHLTGKADFKSNFILLDTFSLPFDKTGKIDLTK